MLDKLSSRERILAIVVIAVVPVFLLYSIGSYALGTLSSKDVEISRLDNINRTEKHKERIGLQAMQRREGYNSASLPTNTDTGFNDYNEWINNLFSDCGMDAPLYSRVAGTLRRAQGIQVFETRKGKYDGIGTLDQIVQLTYGFEQKNILHRITTFTMVPVEGSPEGPNQEFRISLIVEVMGLAKAVLQTGLPEGNWKRLENSMEEYRDAIVRRNIFGPPNNAPSITTTTPPKVEPGKPIQFVIQADDADANDDVSLELIATSGNGAELVQKDGAKSARFTHPGFEKEGRYSYEAKVTDNGCPPKFSTRKFTIVVEVEEEVIVTQSDPVRFAKVTKINGFGQNVLGEKVVWINFQSENEEKTLSIGDSFDLDEMTWTIKSLDFNSVVIQCNDKELTFKTGDTLANPVETSLIPDSVSVTNENKNQR